MHYAADGKDQVDERPGLLTLLLAFGRIGATSFGGGATTLALMRREAVERHGWLTAEEFTLGFGMAQLVPGINLLGLTVLIGHRTRGAAGVAVSLLGLTVPAFALTVAFCALLRAQGLRRWSAAAMRGALPVVIALLLDTAFRMAEQSLQSPSAPGTAGQGTPPTDPSPLISPTPEPPNTCTPEPPNPRTTEPLNTQPPVPAHPPLNPLPHGRSSVGDGSGVPAAGSPGTPRSAPGSIRSLMVTAQRCLPHILRPIRNPKSEIRNWRTVAARFCLTRTRRALRTPRLGLAALPIAAFVASALFHWHPALIVLVAGALTAGASIVRGHRA